MGRKASERLEPLIRKIMEMSSENDNTPMYAGYM